MCQNYVNLFFSGVILVIFLTVIWVAKVRSYGICFHPKLEAISLGIYLCWCGYVVFCGKAEGQFEKSADCESETLSHGHDTFPKR